MAGLMNNYHVSKTDVSNGDDVNDSARCETSSAAATVTTAANELLRANGIVTDDRDVSLQELIENELTFKISSSFKSDGSAVVAADNNNSSKISASVANAAGVVNGAAADNAVAATVSTTTTTSSSSCSSSSISSGSDTLTDSINVTITNNEVTTNRLVSEDTGSGTAAAASSSSSNVYSFLTETSDDSSAITVIECTNRKLLLTSSSCSVSAAQQEDINNTSYFSSIIDDDDKFDAAAAVVVDVVEDVAKNSKLDSIELAPKIIMDKEEAEQQQQQQQYDSIGGNNPFIITTKSGDETFEENNKSEIAAAAAASMMIIDNQFSIRRDKVDNEQHSYDEHVDGKKYGAQKKQNGDSRETTELVVKTRLSSDEVVPEVNGTIINIVRLVEENESISSPSTETEEQHATSNLSGGTTSMIEDPLISLDSLTPVVITNNFIASTPSAAIANPITAATTNIINILPASNADFSPLLIAGSSFDVSHIVDNDDMYGILNNPSSADNKGVVKADDNKSSLLLDNKINGNNAVDDRQSNGQEGYPALVDYTIKSLDCSKTIRPIDDHEDAVAVVVAAAAAETTSRKKMLLADFEEDEFEEFNDETTNTSSVIINSSADNVMTTSFANSTAISDDDAAVVRDSLEIGRHDESSYSLSVASWDERTSDYLDNDLADTSTTLDQNQSSDVVDRVDVKQSSSSSSSSLIKSKTVTNNEDNGAGNIVGLMSGLTKSNFSSTRDEYNEHSAISDYHHTEVKDLNGDANAVEKKLVKKKKSCSTEEITTTTKVKKTKKTKKYDEKENISVTIVDQKIKMEDGFFHQITDDTDELSNVCVRDLKLTYSNNKPTTKDKSMKPIQVEEPVASSVPIDVLKTCSLGDLRLAEKVYKRKSSSEEDYFPPTTYSSRISKSGFGKFDQMIKKPVLHVRSSDASKAQQQFGQNKIQPEEAVCKACNKVVFAMEQIKAERHVWHKNCFRCKTCSKQLTVDIYSSHEGELFCKPHFRDLFKPKVVVDNDEPVKLRKPELIIRENEPLVLPPDVIRASDKPDLGLEELSSLNVMSRFQVFEKPPVKENDMEKSPVNVKRSQSILNKLARFQAKGMDVGVSSDIFNSINYEESSSSDEDQNDNVVKSNVTREKPIAFNKMDDVKKSFESGQAARKEERREERRQELQHIRSRLFMGKQGKMKEAYEQAVAESGRGPVKQRDVEVKSDKARTIKERFERGEVAVGDNSDEDQDSKNNKTTVKDEDFNVFEAGISKKSRSMFQQMDANIAKTKSSNAIPAVVNSNNAHQEGCKTKIVTSQISTSPSSGDIVRSSDPVAEVSVETEAVSSKFKFFETYKPPEIARKHFRITPPREGQVKDETPERETEPDTAQSDNVIDEETELKKSQTTAKMLSFFRQMEEAQDTVQDGGRKPLKKFTPPPVSSSGSSSSEEESEEESEEGPSEASTVPDDIIRASDKVEDEFLKQAQTAARAKALKEKFEHWTPEKQTTSSGQATVNNNNNNINNTNNNNVVPEGEQTKSLRAKFELLRSEQPTASADKPRPKVNRFIDDMCAKCHLKVYPLEKVDADGKSFHRNCFKCTHCKCILRMDKFTTNGGQLYCLPHFKQLFITKGNYDEGFGNSQHKKKWNVDPLVSSVNITNGSL